MFGLGVGKKSAKEQDALQHATLTLTLTLTLQHANPNPDPDPKLNANPNPSPSPNPNPSLNPHPNPNQDALQQELRAVHLPTSPYISLISLYLPNRTRCSSSCGRWGRRLRPQRRGTHRT